MKVLNFIAVAVGTAFLVFWTPLLLSYPQIETTGNLVAGSLADVKYLICTISLIVGVAFAMVLRPKLGRDYLQIQPFVVVIVAVLAILGMTVFFDVGSFISNSLLLVVKISMTVFFFWLSYAVMDTFSRG